LFAGEDCQLREVRRWVASLLPECPARDDVACVATELGTNAVRHTASGRGGSFSVEIIWHRQWVRVAVTDAGAPDGPRLIDDPLVEHGRGLLIVRGMSARTGVRGDHRGRLVWADVPWAGTSAVEPEPFADPYEETVRDGQAALASRFSGVPAWFGRSTRQWWALAADELVAAPSVQELAIVLGRVLNRQPRWKPAASASRGNTTAARPPGQQPQPVDPMPLGARRASGAIHAAG